MQRAHHISWTMYRSGGRKRGDEMMMERFMIPMMSLMISASSRWTLAESSFGVEEMSYQRQWLRHI